MSRPIWSGSIAFGLVNVPVKAFPAVRDHDVHFHQVDRKSHKRIRYAKMAGESRRQVDADDIVMSFDLGDGRHVTFDSDELDAIRPRSTKTVDVTDFVALADIDPVYYERTYWLAPDGDSAARPYQLLRAAMERQERAAIGTVAMRNKQYLAAIRPLDGVLAMSTMRFADEVVPRGEIDELPSRRATPAAKELRMAEQLIDALAADWKPERYHDTYVEELRGSDRGQGRRRRDRRRRRRARAERRHRRSHRGPSAQPRPGSRAQAAPFRLAPISSVSG